MRRHVSWVLFAAACSTPAPDRPAPPQSPVNVRIVPDEARAALDILARRERNGSASESEWNALFATEGYRRLRQREAAMKRPFTDSAFKAFLTEMPLGRGRVLATLLPHYEQMPLQEAAEQALSYLPGGAHIDATLYPLIKPIPNTFVFTADSVAGIFLYMDPERTAEQETNTVAHELHHLGYATVCDMRADSTKSAAEQMLYVRLFGFGEGLAMLAASGGPDLHPHAVSDTADRNRWDRDLAHQADDMRAVEQLISATLDGTLSADSVLKAAISFYGVQGPWYTVGWRMAWAVERALGRDRLLQDMCSPARLMRSYNTAEEILRRRGETPLPTWSSDVLDRLSRIFPS